MTHDTDCRVLDEYRDEVDEIAELFKAGKYETARERAEGEMGWEFLGEGVSRIVYRVATEKQEGPVEDVTHAAPCVIKFDTESYIGAGFGQNADEYNQFQQFPEEIRDPDEGVPAVVPIRDHGEDYTWLSMPEASQRGDTNAMIRRLSKRGWKCEDLHHDNIGEMHGVPVVLDYGLDCSEASRPEAIAEELEVELRSADATVRTSYEVRDWSTSPSSSGGTGEWVVEFFPADWVTPDLRRPVEPSTARVDARGVITDVAFVFGGYNVNGDGEPEGLTDATEAVVAEIEDSWLGVFPRVKPVSKKVGGKMVRSIAFTFAFDGSPEMPPEILVELWEDVATEVKSEFPDDPTQGGRPSGTLGSIEHDIEQSIAETAEEQVETDIEEALEREMQKEELEDAIEGAE